MTETTVIRKVFGSGQVTLPKSWRTKVKTSTVSIREKNGELLIAPLKSKKERVIFDSADFGQPKGIEINKFLAALKKANRNG